MVTFLLKVPWFEGQTGLAFKRLETTIKRVTYIRKQVVYTEGQPAENVYIVKNGEFILEKKLEKQISSTNEKITKLLGKTKRNIDGTKASTNIIASKLTEIKDFP